LNNKKRIIAVFFAGLITALFLLEISLRIAGGISRSSLVSNVLSTAGKQDKPYIILCLGNSFTVGAGAPKGQSYPSQLQKLLDKEAKGRKVKVINAGVSNQNSTELLNRLQYNIIRNNPDLIILQTGQANFWNQYHYKMYLETKPDVDSFFRRFILSLNDLLYCSRVYRLGVLLVYNIKEEGARKNPQVKELNSCYLEIFDWVHYGLRHKEIPHFDQEKALNYLKERIKLNPAEISNYRYIATIYSYQKNYKEAVNWAIRGIRADPGYRSMGGENKNYALLRMIYKNSRDEKIRKLIKEFIFDFKKTNPGDSVNLLFLENQEIYNWIESDIKEIIRTIQNKGIKIILQNYPPNIDNEKTIYFDKFILPKIAGSFKIALVDNNRIFQEALDKGAKWDDFFERGGHCNAKGYGIMANNIFDKIKEERIIDLN